MVKKTERRNVQRQFDVDTARLFGDSLKASAEYLLEVQAAHPDKALSLTEGWIGYEDNYFAFSYDELETDEEFEARIEQEKLRRERAAAEAAQQRKKDEAELRRLKAKLGVP